MVSVTKFTVKTNDMSISLGKEREDIMGCFLLKSPIPTSPSSQLIDPYNCCVLNTFKSAVTALNICGDVLESEENHPTFSQGCHKDWSCWVHTRSRRESRSYWFPLFYFLYFLMKVAKDYLCSDLVLSNSLLLGSHWDFSWNFVHERM